MYLGTARLRVAGAEGGLRVLQRILNPHCGRVRATKHTPRDRYQILERRHSLMALVERGTGVVAERRRVNRPKPYINVWRGLCPARERGARARGKSRDHDSV